MTGSQIGHFEILDLLGKGGMGEVYRAEDTKLGRTVAIKFLARELVNTPVYCERFLREARAIAALNHPHICTIFETGEHERRPFFVMEYLEGTTLKDVVADGPLDQATLNSVAMQLADALTAAHGKGILHRDLKPANIIRDPQGNIKLLDFGLAKDLSPDSVSVDDTIVLDEDSAPQDASVTMPITVQPMLTQTGTTLGTYAYMSPEQLRGEELDQRSDLFAFGLILFELATGKPAFTGNTAALLIDAVLNRPVPAPATIRSDLSPQMNAVVQRLTAKNREERLDSAAEVRTALMLAEPIRVIASSEDGEQAFLTTLGRKRSPWGVILGSIGAAFLGGWYGQDEAWIGLTGLFLVLCGGLLWWWEGRKVRRKRTGDKLRITRLEEESPGRAWLYTYIFLWGAALFYTYVCGLGAWAVFVKRSPNTGAGSLVFFLGITAFLWIGVINGRRWRDKPPARKSQELEIQASYAQILSRISRIISELEAQVTGLNLEEGLVRATTSTSLKTWGSRLSFSITERNSGIFSVRIVSEPVVSFELLEFGRNKANVRRAVELLVQD